MAKTFLIHYSEIALKGKNRPVFESQLANNIRLAASRASVKARVDRLWGRMVLTSDKPRQTKDFLKKIFAIAWFAPTTKVVPTIPNFKKEITRLAKGKKFSTFAIRAHVADKSLPFSRRELEKELGQFVVDQFKKNVSLDEPEKTFFVEVASGKDAFLFLEKIPGLSGLPPGVSGRVGCLLSGGIDSPVAAFQMMGRGAEAVLIHFHSYPKTSQASIEKVKKIARTLSAYQPEVKLYLLPLLPLQKKIVSLVNDRFLILLYRRAMLKISELITKREKGKALVTGDSLGQVASQTIENLAIQNEAVSLPIFRPLIGMEKEKIIALAKKIDTFPISILPHQDCCSLFLPKRPATRARLEDVLGEEKAIKGYTKMITDCLKKAEIVNFK